MKLTEQERNEIADMISTFGYSPLPSKMDYIIDRIESILSRPEQGGEEMTAIKLMNERFYRVWGLDSDIRALIVSTMEEYAQLRTESLRSELAEAKREVERLNRLNESNMQYFAMIQNPIK